MSRVRVTRRNVTLTEKGDGDSMREHYHWSLADYQSEQWKEVREHARRRTDGLCQLCGLVSGSIGHHLRYDHPDEQSADWVAWLCTVCHSLADTARSMVHDYRRTHLATFAMLRAAYARAAPKILQAIREELDVVVREALDQPTESPDRCSGRLRPISGADDSVPEDSTSVGW